MEAALSDPVSDQYREFPCDLCGADEAVEVPHCREFLAEGTAHICCRCGFVYVRRRRASRRIAEVWSQDIFGQGYTASIPAVRARQTYVAEFLNNAVGLRGKTVCEIGAGEGHGLELVREARYGASVFGVEPSPANGQRLHAAGIDYFTGTIEDFVDSPGAAGRFDVVLIQ